MWRPCGPYSASYKTAYKHMRYTKRRPGEYCQPTPDACSRTVEAWGPLLRKLARDLMRHRNSYSTTHTDGPSAVSCANTSVVCSGCQENVSTLRTWRNCLSRASTMVFGCVAVATADTAAVVCYCLLLVLCVVDHKHDFQTAGKRQGFWLSPWCCPSPCLFQFFISSNEF